MAYTVLPAVDRTNSEAVSHTRVLVALELLAYYHVMSYFRPSWV